MATNNAINLKSSGIASYDGAGVFSALANPLIVANGGTGATSFTAYAVLCAGTTSTNPIQSIAGVGTATQALTSNGSGALPTFQTATAVAKEVIYWLQTTANPADSTTYSMRYGSSITGFTNQDTCRTYVAVTGTINNVYGLITVDGTLGSNESVTIRLEKNGSTTANITTSLTLDSASVTFSTTSLGLAVTAGDYIKFQMVTPVWGTNPTTVRLTASVLIS